MFCVNSENLLTAQRDTKINIKHKITPFYPPYSISTLYANV